MAKCKVPTCKRTAPWTCWRCEKKVCEHHCTSKHSDGSKLATCGRCTAILAGSFKESR